MHHSKNCVEMFLEGIEDEVKQYHATFCQQPITDLTDVSKREHEAAKEFHVYFKEFNGSENRKKGKGSLPSHK